MTLGGQTPGQRGQTHRRLDAGEVRGGGGDRKSPSGDQSSGGGHLHGDGTHPHPFRRVLGAGEGCGDGSDERSGDALWSAKGRRLQLGTCHGEGGIVFGAHRRAFGADEGSGRPCAPRIIDGNRRPEVEKMAATAMTLDSGHDSLLGDREEHSGDLGHVI